jgi:O-antigen ligase
MWRLAPFYLALAAAPLLFGGVKPESQATLGILLSLALILTHSERAGKIAAVPRWLKFAILIFILLPLIPLPFALVKILSPERARLAAEFPIDGVVPGWLALSTSPARTVQRLWELTIAAAAFLLARHSASRPGAARALALTVATALVLLGATELWLRAHGRENILGLWRVSWGKAYGSFANHNHFANWIYIAVMFCAGWIARELFRRERKSSAAEILFVAIAALFALSLAFLSASRGGAASFVVGILTVLFLFRDRLQRNRTRLAASFAIIAAIALSLIFSEKLVERFLNDHTTHTLDYKTQIWSQTASIIKKFPLFGAGPGSFLRVYNFYKTDAGDSAFLHAENDYIELPLEYGLHGATFLFVAILIVVRKSFARIDTPLIAGIAGALTIFAIHCCGEFISYVPANLILIASLLGFALGRSTVASETNPRPLQLAAAFAMLAISVLQFAAWFQFSQATAPQVQRSIALWPFAPNREIALLRLRSRDKSVRASEPASLHRALQLDPLNWELRLEQTWYQLAFSTNKARALSNAWITVRLNPLQGRIPLRFAQHFARRDPDTAFAFLAAVNPAVPSDHESALSLAWQITRDPTQLWNLTPDTIPSLQNLIHFAQTNHLKPIAAQAARALEGRLNPITLGQILLDSDRPDESLRLTADNDSPAALRLRVLALHQLRRYPDAIATAQKLFTSIPSLQSSYQVTASHSQLLQQHQSNPADSAIALLLAEKTAAMAPIDLPLLATLSQQFLNEPRIAYLLFQSQLKSAQTNAASQTAAQLAASLGKDQP